ncbi:hypothetical protein BS47DRAFT_1293967 [Hydnum rufescens UP504]|uniref:UBN2_3 domain-containing protein n=1 Tax=Hydnum rufescens UP504 TaxID=1448309 RepID=A0A9P6DVJ3_9AGAM|nr:hypothetical protein BS47DRAFT_1293967 [Hydnum rufescens UP504]
MSIPKDTISGFTQIDQLKGDNWVAWKSHVTALLCLSGLYGLVNGMDPWPDLPKIGDLTTQEIKAERMWDMKDQQTQLLLQLVVSDTELVHLLGASMAHQMWKQLLEVKEPKGTLGVLMARQ